MRGVSNRSHAAWLGLGLALSVTVHGAVTHGFLAGEERSGAIEQETAAISVNLLETRVVDAAEESEALEAAASVAQTQGNAEQDEEGEQVEEPQHEVEEPESEPVEEPEPEPVEHVEPEPKPVQEPEAEPEPQPVEQQVADRLPALPPRLPREVEVERERLERQRQAEQARREREQALRRQEARKKAKRRAERQARKRGADSSSRGQSGSRGQRGRVSASTGARRKYRDVVRARLERYKSSARLSRAVEVTFTVSSNGGVRSVRVTRSSGNSADERAALGVVHRAAPFPPPPQGVSRTFTVPFNPSRR